MRLIIFAVAVLSEILSWSAIFMAGMCVCVCVCVHVKRMCESIICVQSCTYACLHACTHTCMHACIQGHMSTHIGLRF